MWRGYRPSARLGVVLCGAALGLGLWSWLYRGSSPGGSPEEALGALLVEEGLLVTEARLLGDPAARGWLQGRGWVPGFALARDAQEGEESAEDVYSLEARVDAGGAPLQVRRVSNLTRTPYAREHLLAWEGSRALLGVEVFGAQQSLLLVDFAGDERDLEAMGGWAAQARQRVTNLQQTGRADGVGLRLYGLEPAARRLSAQARGGGFAVSVYDDKGEGRSLTFGPEGLIGEAPGVQYQPRFWASKAPVPWVVDTIRDLSFVGPRKVALLEQFVFRWKDNMQQTAFQAGLVSEDGALQEELGEAPAARPAGPAATLAEARAAEQGWPPRAVTPAVSPPSDGEGQWSAVEYPWLRALPGAPPAFYRTAVRMDPKRPYDAIALVAADMRQLDLGMVAGTVTPESSFGNRGDGLIPRAPEVLDRVVAAFNGGFKTAHGAFGMIVERTTILPPIPYSATLAVRDDGQVKMGTWYNSMTPPPELRSLRQNLPPLMADGKFNPTGKRKWGGTASDLDDIHTTRSGVGISAPHTLVYAWCKSCSADALGAALLGAGCEYGMHLDMNPTHTGWSYYRAESADLDDKGKLTRFEVAKASPRMDFEEGRYVNRDVKDFFYLTLRRDLAMTLPAPPEGFSPWSADHAPRGPEGFLALAAASRGPAEGELLVALEGPGLRARARLGDREPGVAAGRPAVALQGPVAVLDLGLASADAPGGVLGGGVTAAPLAADQPALWVDADGRWALLAPTEARARGAEVALLRGGPALIKGGEPVPAALAAPGTRQHALGVDARGRLFYLSASGDAASLAARLRAVGVVEAMLLPPGAQPRLRFVDAAEGALTEVDPVTGQRSPLREDRGATTQLWLERGDAPPRVARLKLEDVTLDPEEEKRQHRLQAQIKALREELRRVENAKYQKFIEKKNTPPQ